MSSPYLWGGIPLISGTTPNRHPAIHEDCCCVRCQYCLTHASVPPAYTVTFDGIVDEDCDECELTDEAVKLNGHAFEVEAISYASVDTCWYDLVISSTAGKWCAYS